MRYLDGDKLLKARLEARLSQGELAAKVGGKVTQSLVSAWERGRQGTDLTMIGTLAEVLAVTVSDLMPDSLLTRIEAEDKALLARLAARGVVIEIPAAARSNAA